MEKTESVIPYSGDYPEAWEDGAPLPEKVRIIQALVLAARIPDAGRLTKFEDAGNAMKTRALAMAVTTDEEYQHAGLALQTIAGHTDAIELLFKDPKSFLFKAHRFVCAVENLLAGPPGEASAHLRKLRDEYREEEEKRRAAEERRLAEQLRKEEEDRRLEEAQTLAAEGHPEEAEAILDRPVTVPAVRVARPPEPKGVSVRHGWGYRVLNEAGITRPYLEPAHTKIAGVVRALGPDAAALVGGIEVFRTTTEAVRRR